MAIDPLTGLPSSNNPVASTSTGYVPSTISTATMTPVTQVPVPAATPVPTSTYTAPVNSVADSLTSLQQEAKDRQTAVDQANARGSEYAGLIATAQGQNIKDVAGTYASQGVNTAYNQLQDLAAQATGLKNEAAAIPIQNAIAYRGNAGVSSGVDTVSRDQLAQNALKALSLGQQYAIAEGNYNKAKNIADQLIDTKYAAEEARIKSLQTQQAAYEKYTLTPMEQKRLDAVKKATDLEASQLAEKKANEKGISDLITNAAGQGAPQALRDKAAKAKTPMEAANILGQYAGDYLAKEKIKAEIRKMDADAAKTRADANAVSGAGSPAGATSNAKAWLDQYNSGALSLEDIYTKIGSSKEAGVLKNQVAQLVAAQGGKRKYGTDDASVQAINAQIKNVNDLLYGNGKTEADKTTGGVGKIVGVVQGGGGIFLPDSLNVGKQDALAVAKNLVSNQTLQALADAKSKGITFGALSEGELGLVSDAASNIASKLIKDKDGNITGFSGSESQFKKDLLKVKEGLQKSIVTKTQSTQPNQSKVDTTADDIMTANKTVQTQINGSYNIFDK